MVEQTSDLAKVPYTHNGERWVEQWDDIAQVPYMYKGERWVSYDNQRSVAVKVLRIQLTMLNL